MYSGGIMNTEKLNKRTIRTKMGEEKWTEYQKIRNSIKVLKWRKRAKKRLIEYKGGRCEKCGYDKKMSNVYDFHHIDPNEKEFGIAEGGTIRSLAKMKKEVDKCMLLCSNCHREIHQIENDNTFIGTLKRKEEEIKKLKGEFV